MLREIIYTYQFQKNTWKSRGELEDIQNSKLRLLIQHAYQNVPFYREVFKKRNLRPDDIKMVKDLPKLPVIRKSDIKHRQEDFIARNYDVNRCRKTHTSGSTGIPLTLYTDPRGESYNKAVNMRALFENGMTAADRIMEITHPENIFSPTWLQRVGIFKKKRLSVYDLPEKNVRKFSEYAPDIFIGYPSILKMMADYIMQNNIKIISPKKIFTSAEMLFDNAREKIVTTFGCDVIDLYGCTEFRRLAWECSKREGYHTDIDYAVVEIIKSAGLEAVDGSIVVTGLHNYAMPLIRYENGDAAHVSPRMCSCGRGLPLLEKIKGRLDDMIILPSGRVISPRSINVLDYIEGINQYRIIQEKKDFFVVQVEKNKHFSKKTRQEIEEQICKGCMHEQVTISIEEVEKIPQDTSGKIRAVISKIAK